MAHDRVIKVLPVKVAKKTAGKKKKMGKFNAFNGCLASKKAAIAMHIKDMFDAIEVRKEASNKN